MDVLSGIGTPQKIGPLLRAADVVLLTRGDLVSQAERDVFRLRVAQVNRRAEILEVNGLTGQGSRFVAARMLASKEVSKEVLRGDDFKLRFAMPAAVCSFCLGEKRAGSEFASGNVRMMGLPTASREPSPGSRSER